MTIKSMTGYGSGECLQYDRKFKVEIKSVNHRFSDVTIKMPRFLNPFEDQIRKRLAQDIQRGKVDVWVGFESFTKDDVSVSVNTALADAYMDALTRLAKQYFDGTISGTVGLELLAKNPDIITVDRFENTLSTEQTQHELFETLSGALTAALNQFNHMRKAEGDALCHDVLNNHEKLVLLVAEIKKRIPDAEAENANRLYERVRELCTKTNQQPDDGRMMTEIALLADKSCIEEEVTRLESHLSQLKAMLSEPDPVGRKLDFLVQELNREANTIGSKSSDIELNKLAVELKSIIEKIREQVQNIE